MYFPTTASRRLCTTPLTDAPEEPVICIVPNPKKSLFCALTRSGIALWRVRPSAILSYLSRTTTSLSEHGENAHVHWSPDGTRIVVQSTESYLVLVYVEYNLADVAYRPPHISSNAQRNFPTGAGENLPLPSLSLRFEGVIRVEGQLLAVSARRHHIMLSIKDPPGVQRIPWPTSEDEDQSEDMRHQTSPMTWMLNEEEFPWLVDADVMVSRFLSSRANGMDTWLTSDGRVYIVHLSDDVVSDVSTSDLGRTADDEFNQGSDLSRLSSDHSVSSHHAIWHGSCVHDFEPPKWVQKQRRLNPDEIDEKRVPYIHPERAVGLAINTKFSLVAIGTHDGSVKVTNFPIAEEISSPSQVLQIPNAFNLQTGVVCAMEWSSDGYVLAVGWEAGWAIFSVGGRCLAWGFGVDGSIDKNKFQDTFMFGISHLFWAPGNFELFALAHRSQQRGGQLFVIPFAKSATTGQHSPDNTRYAFLQLDDRCLVYRGADQPDMSVINPESDVWQHIKIPQSYVSTNWPIRYSSLSSDGRLIAVAGQRGLAHYSSTSGRWKMFADERQEQAFTVRGGMLWFHHVLIAAVDVAKSYQIRLYSRDLELSNQSVLHRELLTSPVIILSLVDNSLLVYTANNTLYHFVVVPTSDTIQLHLCGSITFDGMITTPSAVRLLSWMIPTAHKQLGDPMDDLSVATVLMMVGGQLVLLRPRRSGSNEVKYDMQIFADRIEFCWTHLRGIGALENSLWGYDGKGLRVWLNALSIDAPPGDPMQPHESVKESVNISLDFYPLSVLMDKGIIIGVEHEVATRTNLPFVMFRHATSSQLFLDHVLRLHLEAGQVSEAVQFAAHYQNLVYFSHALEILLHSVVESEAMDEGSEAPQTTVLPTVVEFLDHFDKSLEVVVGCARKTEMTRWPHLFNIVGNPKALFETCMATHRLKTAASYLLVLHHLEQLDQGNGEVVRLLRGAINAEDWRLCQDLLRFIHSIDETGNTLRNVLAETDLVPDFMESLAPRENGEAC